MSVNIAAAGRLEVGGMAHNPLKTDISRHKPTLCRENMVFDQQMERVNLWIQDWDHQQRCAILRALVTWSRHGQIQFLRTASLPALHRDFMYSASSQFPDKQFVPISTFYSRKLKNRQIMLAHRKDSKDYHRISSAHLHHQDELAEYVDELRLPHIQSPVSRPLSWDRDSVAESNRSRWGVEPIGKSQSDPLNLSSWPLESLTDKIDGWSLTSPTSKAGQSAPAPGKTDPGCTGPITSPTTERQERPDMKRTVTWRLPDEQTKQERAFVNDHTDIKTGTSSTRSSISQLSFRKKRIRDSLRRSKTDIDYSDHQRRSKTDSVDSSKTSNTGTHNCDEIRGASRVPAEGAQVVSWYLTQWNDKQRNEFLRRFLLKLDPRQHYFVSSILAVRSRMDLLTYLPESVSIKILSHLTSRQLGRASLVCKRWHQLCNSNKLWKNKCSQIQLAIPVLSTKPDWKKLYQDNRNIKANWDQGRCKVVDCKGHTDRVLSVTFDERRMATGSVDKIIRIWKLDTGRCIQTLRGHLRGVWCLRFFGKNLLLSGSYDCSIKVWNLRDGICVRTMLGHEGPVWAIVWRGSKLASASHDKTARIWDVGRCYLLHTLTGHKGAVYCIDMDETGAVCFTGSSDKTVRLWDTNSGTQLQVVRVSDRSAIMSVSYSNNILACSYWDTIAIYRINNKLTAAKCIQKYEEHYKRIECLELKVDPVKGTGTLISGGKDGILKYWDISKEHSIQTYKGHNKTINCVHCDAFRIATASYDNRIKIWDFRS